MKSRLWMAAWVSPCSDWPSRCLPAATSRKMKVNVGSTFRPGAPVYMGQEKFKELVEQRSKGEIESLSVLGAMGGERDVFEAMSTGGLEIGAMDRGTSRSSSPGTWCSRCPMS